MSKNLSIIVGSVLGASEYVAEALEQIAQQAGYQTEVHFSPNFAEINPDHIWVICTSTHGAGELPENIQAFAKAITETSLTGVQAYIVGLGDSSYDTFCYGAIDMESRLKNAGATLLGKPLHIDVLNHPIPEDVAVAWFEDQLNN
ncbi:flavodoxin domain-containing protein [Alteromonas sp. C1M14]|uniref:flavodoxin domain-containing protein n=1 Tax=Alteromonas sp. C1M14 TaxID=2841567 RepID=UPI001C093B5E|nr:flavodoxin domain-containing protein [Alteromonas sp. C1M14]MBU2978436.1 flavodoxin domain-containing protein [Alteromonas sp. C1M14]